MFDRAALGARTRLGQCQQAATGKRRRLTYDEMGRNVPFLLLRVRIVRLDGCSKRLNCSCGKVLARHLHRGKRRQHKLCQVDVVESDYGNVIRNHFLGSMQTMKNTYRRHIVGADDGGGKLAQGKQLLAALDSTIHGVRAFDHVRFRNGESHLGHRGEKGIASRHGGAHSKWAADKGNLAMPERREMLYGFANSLPIVNLENPDVRYIGAGINKYQW